MNYVAFVFTHWQFFLAGYLGIIAVCAAWGIMYYLSHKPLSDGDNDEAENARQYKAIKDRMKEWKKWQK